ncbi:MAG: hypothetical protein HQK83_19540 [Fibrobacteria bacterium]|nr:hypothetical protein [Fibrobacteria bacterium]
MREPLVDFKPTLSEVHSRFTAWRKTKAHRSRIPEELWAAAVLLIPDNSLHKVARTLSLGHKDLKKRVESHNTAKDSSLSPSSNFIPIDIPQQHSAECTIEMAHFNGNRMRMHFTGKAELDLQSFAESFWAGR